ncbi:MAG: SWF/SNF helicase family protein, partial [Bacteroidales bacterium]|nr:SWF/SNF helicase family protein [Bacteroidales bacterium]
ENQRRKNKQTDASTKKEAEKIAKKIRDIIYPLVIRRSRIDLEEIEEYKKDIQQQKISFPKVHNPILLDYSLGSLEKLYVKTLEKISSEDKRNSFKGTRYKPVVYVKNFEKYKKSIEEQFGEFHLFKEAQQNLSRFMRHLLVRRFESSMFAFRTTLEYMIHSSENILKWMEARITVPIFKQGYLPDIEDFYETTIDNTSVVFNELAFDEAIEKLQNKGLFEIPENEISVEFKSDLEHDIKILKTIYNEWFEQQLEDPKLQSFKTIIKEMLQQEPNRKIVVFSEFSDTVNYLYDNLKNDFRVFKFTSADANDKNRRIIQLNFDAGISDEQQQNDFDILVATDAISEGYNLHRAGAIFNYDIPYNPTRVIQRVGRINRINRKVFDELFIYNYFPTETGEKETQTRQISTLKMAMIHALLGEDTRILTSDEELQAFFKERYQAEMAKSEERSWENKYLNFYKSLPQQVIEEALKIPSRVRIKRTVSKDCQGVLVFGKKGENAVFRLGESAVSDKNVTAQEALMLLEAEIAENASNVSEKFDEIYQFVKRNLFQQLMAVKPDKKKSDACNKISLALQLKHTTNTDYFNDLLKVIQANALPAIYLKTINKTKISEIDKIMTLIPYSYIETILMQIKEVEESAETIIVAEEFV